MTGASEFTVVACEDVLARSTEEAVQKEFDAAEASLADGAHEFRFADEVELSAGSEQEAGTDSHVIEEGPSPFKHRGL